jgi:hypothetical protein
VAIGGTTRRAVLWCKARLFVAPALSAPLAPLRATPLAAGLFLRNMAGAAMLNDARSARPPGSKACCGPRRLRPWRGVSFRLKTRNAASIVILRSLRIFWWYCSRHRGTS